MNVNIEFFLNDLNKALEAGIYLIEIQKDNKKTSLYIGESVYPMVRCAEHLFNLKNDPDYFGFTNKTIDDTNIKLIFSILENEYDTAKRKAKEKELITKKKPISQSGISDRLSQERIKILNSWLNN